MAQQHQPNGGVGFSALAVAAAKEFLAAGAFSEPARVPEALAARWEIKPQHLTHRDGRRLRRYTFRARSGQPYQGRFFELLEQNRAKDSIYAQLYRLGIPVAWLITEDRPGIPTWIPLIRWEKGAEWSTQRLTRSQEAWVREQTSARQQAATGQLAMFTPRKA